jgi:transcriptional regulator with XRE-family HTH domain
MLQLGINQTQVVGMTGKSKGSVSMYLNDKTVPSVQVQSEIAISLGLDADYFEQDEEPVVKIAKSGTIQRLDVKVAAKLLQMNHTTVEKGLKQRVFPWGYAIHTSENRWVYFINAKRFAEIEGVVI